ncbi:MAG: response regulator [Desulfamplus sp.]|nr:response regulator [Desulfamplus sp.]MBF0411585.1 response regulator [Desulfamplus sp.]
MKILVIDDEKPTLSMFKLFLTAYGYQVFIAEDGKTGLDLFAKEQPQIVFTDLKMPRMDGIEVLRKIRSFNDPTTQVIIITGHGDMEKALEALDLDASDFINKPVEKRALESALKRAELRIRNREPKTSEMIINKTSDSSISMKISGKLTSASYAAKQLDLNGVKLLQICFSPDFSIAKEGMDWLIDFMEQARKQGIQITMNGLSYNYIRFFQMAGLHEIAVIVEAKYDE